MDFFLDMLTTEMTPVTSSSSEMMKPLPTSEEKYMKVFFPASLTATPTVPSPPLYPDVYIPTLPLLRPPTEATELALLSSPAPPHQGEGAVRQAAALQRVAVPGHSPQLVEESSISTR